MTTVMVAMSGGVDSSVAALLVKEQGYDAVGATMRIWSGGTAAASSCPACYGPEEEQDIQDAAAVARKLGIPHHVFDLRREFREQVIDMLKREYAGGRTPNPCVVCNRQLKFQALFDAMRHEFPVDLMATGHYARLERDPSGRNLLKKARDSKKDQTYFLFALPREHLQRTLFPVGNLTKDEVREISRRARLGVEAKPESQDFAAGGYASVLDLEPKPGPVLDTAGRTVGRHDGIYMYTVGQRKGLGIAGPHPVYVVDIDRENNALVVGAEDELYHEEALVTNINWLVEEPAGPRRAAAKIRSRGEEADVTICPETPQKVIAKFARPQRAITPGQAMVFYDGDTVLGGGTIESVRR